MKTSLAARRTLAWPRSWMPASISHYCCVTEFNSAFPSAQPEFDNRWSLPSVPTRTCFFLSAFFLFSVGQPHGAPHRTLCEFLDRLAFDCRSGLRLLICVSDALGLQPDTTAPAPSARKLFMAEEDSVPAYHRSSPALSSDFVSVVFAPGGPIPRRSLTSSAKG